MVSTLHSRPPFLRERRKHHTLFVDRAAVNGMLSGASSRGRPDGRGADRSASRAQHCAIGIRE